jgi:hypothetical protein
MDKLLNQIEAAFADADAQSIAALPEIVIAQRAKYQPMLKAMYDAPYGSHAHNVAQNDINFEFSKGFQEDARYGEQGHIERVTKRVEKTHEARNQRILNKMVKAGITSIDVDDFRVIYGEDFEGCWVIGGNLVSINVIWAGGYNIQSLHQRVLVKVTKNKEAA